MFLGSFRPGDRFPQSGIGHVHLKLSEVSPIRYRSSRAFATGWPGIAVPPGSARSRSHRERSVRSRLPQHEIPSKDGVAVPPGPARSLRGQCPILWQGSFDSSRDSRHRSAFATGWPGIAVPPGSARSLPQHRNFFRFPVAPWVFDLELSTLLGESRPGHYLFRTVTS